MKLINKKTGEIKELQDIISDMIDNHIVPTLFVIESEWKDYEEPKDYWYIDLDGEILSDGCVYEDGTTKSMKQIGNYFNTREEAEKAVEKLQAYKRLKDKGFRFIGVRGLGKVIDFDIPEPYNHVCCDEYNATKDEKEFYDDLLLLFGGEE